MKKLISILAVISMLPLISSCSTLSSSLNGSRQDFPRSGLQNYETPAAILTDLETGGMTCENFEQKTGSRHAASSADCDLLLEDDTTKQIILMTFSSETNKEDQADVYRWLGEAIDSYGFVEGGNWMINCGERNICTGLQEILGGRQETKPYV